MIMTKLIADVFITSGGPQSNARIETIKRSLESFHDCTEREQVRLTVCMDGNSRLMESLYQKKRALFKPDYLLMSRENEGLGPTINRAIAHIKSVNDWYSHPTHGDANLVAPYVVMCQDDLLYTKDWLPLLASRFRAYGMQYPLGFASGLECVEHAVRKDLGGGIILKDWIRAAQMMGTREYWESLMPIPRLDPETGRVRARPNDGMGSGVDWWLIRNHPSSVCRTGRTCLVVPGLVQHIGYDRSTWLDRELPESEADKERMRNV